MSTFSKTKFAIAATAAALLAACGGGGGGGGGTQPSTLSLNGVAATGLAIPSANVSVKCTTGTGSANTAASGAYSVSISGGVLPCMLEVTNPADGTKIHSVATGSGTSAVSNLTPLTELVTSRLLRQDSTTYFAGLNAANLATKITTAAISAAQTDVVAALGGTVDTTAISNFISMPMVAATAASPSTGDAQDKVLDALRTKLTPTQIAQVASLLVNTTDASAVRTSVTTIVAASSTYTVSGAVSGLTSGNSVTLLNNAGNSTTVTANGNFSFSTPIAYNGIYAVTVGTQPTGQTCTVSSGTGVVDNASNVGITCQSSAIVVMASTTVTTLAGVLSTSPGTGGFVDGSVSSAKFFRPMGLAVDTGGNVYVADIANYRIRKISTQGVVTTLAGSGQRGSVDGVGVGASFYGPIDVAVDASGNVYVADSDGLSIENNKTKVRKITPEGVVSTLVGGGSYGISEVPREGSQVTPHSLYSVAVDASGTVYFATSSGQIGKLTTQGIVTLLAYGGPQGGEDTPVLGSSGAFIEGVAVDASGNVYVTDASNNKIRKITPQGIVSTLAGSGVQGSSDGVGVAASFRAPCGIDVDTIGNVYVTDLGNSKIRKITPQGVVTTLAGSGNWGYANGIGSAASFNGVTGIAVDSRGNIYVSDQNTNLIRKITPQ